jgi:hypothetical protein
VACSPLADLIIRDLFYAQPISSDPSLRCRAPFLILLSSLSRASLSSCFSLRLPRSVHRSDSFLPRSLSSRGRIRSPRSMLPLRPATLCPSLAADSVRCFPIMILPSRGQSVPWVFGSRFSLPLSPGLSPKAAAVWVSLDSISLPGSSSFWSLLRAVVGLRSLPSPVSLCDLVQSCSPENCVNDVVWF